MARTQAQRSAATQQALLTAARRLWGDRGYAAVSTPEIAQAAGVTRGAMYHQYPDKAKLFLAVLEAVETDVIERLCSGRRRQATKDAGRRAAYRRRCVAGYRQRAGGSATRAARCAQRPRLGRLPRDLAAVRTWHDRTASDGRHRRRRAQASAHPASRHRHDRGTRRGRHEHRQRRRPRAGEVRRTKRDPQPDRGTPEPTRIARHRRSTGDRQTARR